MAYTLLHEGDMSVVLNAQTERTIAGLRALVRSRGAGLVLTHDHPDPDAMAAAVAIAETLAALGAPRALPAFCGILGRRENQAMVDVLGLPFVQLSEVDTTGFDFVVLVDAQPGAGNLSLPEYPPVMGVVDHHPLRHESQLLWVVDVRPDVGATSTIAHQLLLASGRTPSPQLATALFYAIKTDTQDLARGTSPQDVEAYRALVMSVDHGALGRIERPALPVEHFEVLRRALERAFIYDGVLLTTVEALPHPPAAAEIADLLVRTEGVRWTACAGLFGDVVYYSIRTTDPNGNAAEIAERVAEPGGSGGGHPPMAAGRIPRAAFRVRDPGRVLDAVLRRLIAAFGVETEVPRKLLRWRMRVAGGPRRRAPTARSAQRVTGIG